MHLVKVRDGQTGRDFLAVLLGERNVAARRGIRVRAAADRDQHSDTGVVAL